LFLDLPLQFFHQFRVVFDKLLYSVASLSEFVAFIGDRGSWFLDHVQFHAYVEYLARFGNPPAVHDIEFHDLEWWSNLVFHHLYLHAITGNIIGGFLDLADSTDVKPHGSIKLQRVTTGSGFRVAKHDPDLFAELVDKDAGASCFADRPGQLPQRLRHEACL